MNQTILLIEDNPHIMRLNRSVLSSRGYRILEAETLEEGRALLERENPGLIVLDILLPDGNGLDFCEELRGKSGVPILLLTALKEDADIVAGLKRGGDDYMPKPYNMEIFLARVAALLRRGEQGADAVITRGALSLDTGSQTLKVSGEDTPLSQREFTMLLHFVLNEGRVMRAEDLYTAAWGQPMADDVSAVKITVSRLRKKIEPTGLKIVSVRGAGYRFEK